MRTQWKRWNWGLQQNPGRKSRLSQDRKLLLAASTWLDWPLRVSWPPAAGMAVWAALQGTKRCFHCVLIGRPSCRKQQPRQHGLGNVNQTKAQNREAPSERVRVISVVLSVSVVRESGAFSLWWSAVSTYDRLVSNSQLLQISRSRWVSQHMSQTAWRVGCVFSYWSATLLLSYSKGFASPRLELLHNIDPLYYDTAPCKFTFLFFHFNVTGNLFFSMSYNFLN